MTDFYKLEVVPRSEFNRKGPARPNEYEWVAIFRYQERYWSNQMSYTTEYMRSYRHIAAWCYTNLGEKAYHGIEGKGRHHTFLIRTQAQAMLLKLALTPT